MRICILGKFPPIQGGVSARTYWTAHGLAARGHEVHVVTNAKEARPPFRMHMRRKDWKRCEGTYEPTGRKSSTGSVTVHWTDPVDNSQFYIPMASAFVSKLAGIALRLHSERPFDVIYSHYLEPYGVAGHLAAGVARAPHVVRLGGSDAGRLWRHPQLEALYDSILRGAAVLIATGVVAGRAIKHGIDPQRIASVGGLDIPENLFCPEGPRLDLASLRSEVELENPELRQEFWGFFTGELPYFGIYGKLGETKGSFALLSAMQRLKTAGIGVGLVAMAHGREALENKFRAGAEELGIADRVLQIPFLPHWRVPEFLRGCLAVCCLEQDFPIIFHSPVIAREVLACGRCLVGSTEVIRKLPDYERLPDGYGCVAIEDVQNVDDLSTRLAEIARNPELVAPVAARGYAFARAASADAEAVERLEGLLINAVRRPGIAKRAGAASGIDGAADDPRFPNTQSAARLLKKRLRQPIDLAQARKVLAALERETRRGDANLRPVAAAIRLEVAVAEAEDAADAATERLDPLFRLRIDRWAMNEGDLAGFVPIRVPQLRTMALDIQGPPGRSNSRVGTPQPCRIGNLLPANGERRHLHLLSETSAKIIELSDGTRTASEIAVEIEAENSALDRRRVLAEIEELFVSGLLGLQERKTEDPEAAEPR